MRAVHSLGSSCGSRFIGVWTNPFPFQTVPFPIHHSHSNRGMYSDPFNWTPPHALMMTSHDIIRHHMTSQLDSPADDNCHCSMQQAVSRLQPPQSHITATRSWEWAFSAEASKSSFGIVKPPYSSRSVKQPRHYHSHILRSLVMYCIGLHLY